MNSMHTLPQPKILKDIISAYADLWADVMLGKNLENHLKKIDNDFYYVNRLAEIKEKDGNDNKRLVKIADQLYCLRLIILKKLKLRS